MSRSRRTADPVASSSRQPYISRNDTTSSNKRDKRKQAKSHSGHSSGRATQNSLANSPYHVRTAIADDLYDQGEEEPEDEYKPPRQLAPAIKRKRGRPPKNRNTDTHPNDSNQPLRIRLKTSASNSPNVLPTRSSGRKKTASPSDSSSEDGSGSSSDEKETTGHQSTILPAQNSHPGSHASGEDSDGDLLSGGIERAGMNVWELNAPAAFVTWSEDEDALNANAWGTEATEEEEDDGGDEDFQELLAWGNGEMHLEGMPETETEGPANENTHWFETAPSVYGMELDATTDEEDPGVADSEDDQNADSSEELDQMMVINGLYGDSDDSEDGGNTTDTLDDADDDGLARFGIETDEVHVPHDEHKELEDTADGLTRPVTRKQSKKAVNGESLPPPGPSMGDFNLPEPSPFGRKTMTVLDGSQQGPILSPFSVTKVRRRNKRTRSCSESVTPGQRIRRSSFTSSRSTMSAPSIDLNRPSPPSDILEEDEAVLMQLDLDDILEASILGGGEVEVVLQESEGETDADGVQTDGPDLYRWDRVPIGAFRSSRDSHDAHSQRGPVMQNGPFINGNASVYLPITTAILNAAQAQQTSTTWQAAKGNKRVKITRREAIGMSPMLMPFLTSRVPSTIKSRKDRRAEKKRASSQSPGLSTSNGRHFDGSVSPAPDVDVPTLSLENASGSPAPNLPQPTLPSSHVNFCPSPLFSAQAQAAGIPALSLLDDHTHQNIFRR